MFSLGTLVLTGLITLAIGCVVGIVIAPLLHPQEKQNRDLEQRLQKTEDKMANYQQEVSEHFAQTSQLVNSLTQSYKDVHEYLANSALKLTTPDISRQLLEAGKGNLITGDPNKVLDEANFEPPRDWAPKEPGEKGMLSEEYGLEEDPENAEAATVNSVRG